MALFKKSIHKVNHTFPIPFKKINVHHDKFKTQILCCNNKKVNVCMYICTKSIPSTVQKTINDLITFDSLFKSYAIPTLIFSSTIHNIIRVSIENRNGYKLCQAYTLQGFSVSKIKSAILFSFLFFTYCPS